jgi:4-amino-4-deoxy-L-arabinose transferase-like glycosyltransferase
MKWIMLYLIIPILWLFIVSRFTGSKDYVFQTNDDERKQKIKQKAIVQSWVTLVLFFLTNFLLNFFHLNDDKRLENVTLVYPELLYLLVAIVSYFIFLVINNRKMSAN